MNEWLILQNPVVIYVVLVLLLLGGALGLPIPEDVPLVLAGILLQADKISIQTTFPLCYAAVIGGDVLIYWVGRKFGLALFKKRWFKSRFPLSRIKSIRAGLEKRSILMIFIARHLFYLRSLTFLTCGAVRMDFEKFILADALAGLISLAVMIGLGYLAAEHYEAVLQWFEQARNWSLFIGLLALGIFLMYRWRKKFKVVGED